MIDKMAGLATQIRELKNRLKKLDTQKHKATDIKEVVEALDALEARYEKEKARKAERAKSKEETPAAEPTVEKEALPDPKVVDNVETDPKIAPHIITPDSVKKHDDIVERKEKELGPAIIGDKKEEADLLKFAVDDLVEPARGTPGSKGRIMRHDSGKDLAYVMWEEGPMKDKEEFGGYYPQDLKKIVPPHNPGPEHKCPDCDAWRDKEAITLKSDLKSNYEALLKDLKDEREAHYNQGNQPWVNKLDEKIKALEQKMAEKFGNEKEGAEFGQHGNGVGLDDLYVLPSSPEEAAKIEEFLKQSGHDFQRSKANVEGHPWFGKMFIEIPFGESMKDDIAKIQHSKQGAEENGSGGTERLTVKDYTKPYSNSSANADGGKDSDSDYADMWANSDTRNLNSSKKTAKQYDIVNTEGKPVMTVKSTQELSMEQLSKIYEVESKKGNKNVQATLKEDIAFLKKGESVSILAFDKVKGRVKFAHIKEGVRGWCPASKLDIKALDAQTVKHGDHDDKVLGQTDTETLIDCAQGGPTWIPSQGLMDENRPPATPESLHEEPPIEEEADLIEGDPLAGTRGRSHNSPRLKPTPKKDLDKVREELDQSVEEPIEEEASKECADCHGTFEGAEGETCPTCGRFSVQKTAGGSNNEVAQMFISDSFPKDKMPVWGSKNLKIMKQPNGWALVNYETPILYRANGSNTIVFNIQKYSQTTSKIQNALKSMMAGGDVQEVDENGIRTAIDEKPVTPTQPEEKESLQRSLPPVIENQRMDVNDPNNTMEQTASLKKNSTVTHREDGWHVLSEKGKNLGGPYKSKEEAVKRLRQVEYFKHEGSLKKQAAETFIAPVKVDIYDKGELLGHADVTSIKDVNLQWQFEIDMRDWGIKGVGVSIPDQVIELSYEYDIIQEDPTQDGYVPETKQIQLKDVQATGLDNVTWDAHLLPIMLEYSNGKWTVDFGQYNRYSALSKKDISKKAGEMVSDPYSALAIQVQNLKDRMSTVTERLQDAPVEKIASDGSEMDVKELLEDITMGIALVEEKMGAGTEDQETHPIVEEMGNLLMTLEKELGIVPTHSEDVPGAGNESHRPDEMEVELESSEKVAFTSGGTSTTTTTTNVNNAPGTTTAPTPSTSANTTNAPSEGDTPDASNPTCALCGGMAFTSYAQYQDHMEFTHASDTMPTSPNQKNLSTVVGSKKTADVVTDETIVTNDPNAVLPDDTTTDTTAPVIQNVQPTDDDNLEVPVPKPSSPPPPGQIWMYNDVDKAYVAMPDPNQPAGKTI